MENLNSNLVLHKNIKMQKMPLLANHTNITIKNIRFNMSAIGYIKKRDRYRQIFGEKPKFLLIKQNGTVIKQPSKLETTISDFRPR
jgi:hypothetical protein